MRDYILRYRKNTLGTLQAAKRSILGHKKILMALDLKDPVLCEQVMRAHISEAEADAACTMPDASSSRSAAGNIAAGDRRLRSCR